MPSLGKRGRYKKDVRQERDYKVSSAVENSKDRRREASLVKRGILLPWKRRKVTDGMVRHHFSLRVKRGLLRRRKALLHL